MTSLVIINYSGQKTKDLEEQAVLTFVSDLRRAQNMAMAVIDCGGIQTKYGLYNISGKTYNMTCYTQIFELPVNISGDNIYFLPIDINNPTVRVESNGVIITSDVTITIETKQITISPEGKITY